MAKPLSGALVKHIKWSKEGQIVEGVFDGTEIVKAGTADEFTAVKMRGPDGPFTISNSKILAGILEKVTPGAVIRIRFDGSTTNSKGKPLQTFTAWDITEDIGDLEAWLGEKPAASDDDDDDKLPF